MHPTRRTFLAAVGTTAVAGCGELSPVESDEGADTTAPGDESTSAETGTAGTGGATPTEQAGSPTGPASREIPVADTRLPLPMDRAQLRREVVQTGVAQDGIPAIDSPEFVDSQRASTALDDGDVVFGLVRGGVAKAYPQRILVHHEVCNDVVDGDPVSVTYCPLTGTAMGFDPGEWSFGVSGRLLNSNLVMYDRWAEAWWPQILASPIPGPRVESPEPVSLREIRVIWTTWKQWRTVYPDTVVLSEDTGHVRNYGDDPYGRYNPKSGYYGGAAPMYPKLDSSDRFHDKRVVMGARTGQGAVAFLKDALRENGVMTGTLASRSVVAVYDPRLDTAYVYHNPDEAAVRLDGDRAVVAGSEYEPDDLPLDRVYTFDAMWFAWYGFYPETNVYE